MPDHIQIPPEGEIEADEEFTGGAFVGMMFALAIEAGIVLLALAVRWAWRLL